LEKVYVVPLRAAFRTARTKRAAKAIKIVREFLQRHMKTEQVVIGSSINKSVWARGIQKIPRRVRIHADKDENGVVRAEMMGVEIKIPKEKEEEKKEETEIKETKAAVPMKPPEPKAEKPKSKATKKKTTPVKKKGKK